LYIKCINQESNEIIFQEKVPLGRYNKWQVIPKNTLEDGTYYLEFEIYDKENKLLEKYNSNIFKIDTQIEFTINNIIKRTSNNYIQLSGTLDNDIKNINIELKDNNNHLQKTTAILNKTNNTWTTEFQNLNDGFYDIKVIGIDQLNNYKEKILDEFEIDTIVSGTINNIETIIGNLSSDGSSIINISGTLDNDITNITLEIYNQNNEIIYTKDNTNGIIIEDTNWKLENIDLPDNKITNDKYITKVIMSDDLNNTKILYSNDFKINAELSLTIYDILDYSATTKPLFRGELDNDFTQIELEVKNNDESYIVNLRGNINYPYWDAIPEDDLPDDYYTVKVIGTTENGDKKIVQEKNGFTINTIKLIYTYCKEGNIGDKNDYGYTIVDNQLLRDIINGNSDLNLTVDQLCTTKVTDMSHLFENKKDFNGDLTKWDTTNVEDMSYMFYNAESFNTPIHNFITKKVKDMSNMFNGAKSFNQIIMFEYDELNSTKNMFKNATSFNQPMKINAPNLIDASGMFYGAKSFNSEIEINSTNLIDMNSMFYNAENFNNKLITNTLKISNENNSSSLLDIHDLFNNAKHFNEKFQLFIDNVINMSGMFNNALNFNQPLDFNGTTKNVEDMSYMFYNANKFNQPLDFNTTNVKNMSHMFQYANDFNQSLGNFNTQNVEDMSYMFYDANDFNQSINFDSENLLNISHMFQYATNFNQSIILNTQNVKDMSYMFYEVFNFNQPLDFNTTNVKDMSYMFYNNYELNSSIDFNTTNVENMNYMFYNNEVFDQNLSYFCLEKIDTKPIEFDTSTYNWEDEFKPNKWGESCSN
jgi:uncharacterized protein YdeI (BOF family)